eukprot:CAMPEP_0201925696 /NCGR_PEP_ID=MMETSP0903-20130614/14854_1 /ASSEMBLY_ACC=CAM_ASM_000552 /TAXON_ID=420261 /ORGANISM="Thalassiosira antarctica, Strain CCMP982" /LENGTH=258 /DNA_ID=CAMNT_0048463405 /DNA_START=18 /DNA_END=794 /DNA_ORIENTATION=-
MNMAENNPAFNTVVLDVGGRHFKVSRSFIERHPDTMLAMLISDRWNDDPSKPIFIDRDGDIFAHVLNYLRYGSIELPNGLPKSMFQRELGFYGITSNDNCVQQNTSIGEMKIIKEKIDNAELHHDMLLVALYCYQEFMLGRPRCQITKDDVNGLKRKPCSYSLRACMKILNGYLESYYGLEAYHQTLTTEGFDVKVREPFSFDSPVGALSPDSVSKIGGTSTQTPSPFSWQHATSSYATNPPLPSKYSSSNGFDQSMF